jgi:cytochrome c peroxidase
MASRVILAAIAPFFAASVMAIVPVCTAAGDHGPALTVEEQLGKSIFFDNNLSFNSNQACAACHGPEVGFTGPTKKFNEAGAVYEGSIPGRFGNRKPPSAAYATLSPIFNDDEEEGLFVGGNFWDGRATGHKLGNPTADQAQGPFLNPLEQALSDSACVVYRVCNAAYATLFEEVYPFSCAIKFPGSINALCRKGKKVTLGADDRAKSDAAYDNIARAIAAYEASPAVNQYRSKYDAYLAGKAELTLEERQGLNLFRSKGKCANCHLPDPGPNGEPPLFTDFTYDNLGVPRNPENPFYNEPDFNDLGSTWIDLGLGGFLAKTPVLNPDGTNLVPDYSVFAPESDGKQKVPTLRNVDKRPYRKFVKAYMHNGYFKTLEGVVHFYNTRDVLTVCPGDYTEAQALAANCWPVAEVPETVNQEELGDLGLTPAEEDAIVAFLKTLSDGYSHNP